MADADKILKLQIDLDVTGKEDADAAKTALEKAGESTKDAGDAAEEAGISHRELRKVLMDIGNVAAPGAGHALSELAFGPIGAALALVGVYEILKGKIEGLDKDLDAQGDKASEAFSNIKANLYDAIRDEEFSTEKIDAYFKKIEDDANRAKTAIDNALALTKAKDSAAQEVNNAKEQLALEQIKNNPNLNDAQKNTAEAATRDYYAKEKARLEKDQNNAELKSVTAERDDLQKQLEALLLKQRNENSVTPEKRAQIDRTVSQLDPADALRVQYEKDKAAGTIDYAKITNSAAAKDTAAQLESLKNKLGYNDQTREITQGADVARAKKTEDKYGGYIQALTGDGWKSEWGLAGKLSIATGSIVTNDDLSNPQFRKDTAGKFQGEIDVANAAVEADKKRIEQLENAAKIIAEGAEEQKKLNEVIAAAREKVEAANQKLDLATQTTSIKNSAIDTVLKTDAETRGVKPGITELQADKGIADRVVGGQSTNAAEQQRLIAAASQIAGHEVNLTTAAQIIENGAHNMSRLMIQVSRLAQAMSQMNPQAITNLERQIEALQSQMGNSRNTYTSG